MRKTTAMAGSAAFLVIAPGVVAGLVPWWLTGWQAAMRLRQGVQTERSCAK